MMEIMFNQIITSLVLILLFLSRTVCLQDPCLASPVLGNLRERVTGYNLSHGEAPLSDYRLTPGWYSLPKDFTLATKPVPCGTIYNWWMQGKLPAAGQVKVKMCLKDGDDDCSTDTMIQVKKCNVGYVYELKETEADMEAYCIEGKSGHQADDAPDVSGLKPIISAAVIKCQKDCENKLEFYCDFSLPTTEYGKYFYNVEWSLHSGASKQNSIHLAQSVEYVTEQKFRERTKLTEDHLKDSNVLKPGFTIVCSVSARKTVLGPLSRIIDSPPKFCGIEILTPSPIRIQKDENFDIRFKLTIPFGCVVDDCSLEVDMLVPKETMQNCMLSKLAQKIPRRGRSCGFEFKKVNDVATFTVTAAFGTNIATPTSRVYELAFSTQKRNHNHPFFQMYMLPTITVELLVDQRTLQNKDCYSVSDPHMRTFDGLPYENQALGTFILYRHADLEAEVQMKTRSCYNNKRTPYCNCGAAVRAGRDIFVIDNCDGHVRPPRIVYCKDGVLHRQIKRNGATYEVLLPHGTKVSLTISGNGLINIHVHPSVVDTGKSEGLCGVFDNSRNGDQQKRKGSNAAFTDSWRVETREDLFSRDNYKNSKQWLEELFFCDCSHRRGFHDDTECTSQRKCTVDTGSAIREDMCDLHTKRKKRDEHGLIFDGYFDSTTAFYSKIQTEEAPLNVMSPSSAMHHGIKKRRNPYNNVTAREDCLKLMNTETFRMCDKIPDLDIDGLINECVLDGVITNSMTWAMSHLEGIKQICVEYVQVMQPLPPEVRAELVVLPENTSTEDSNGTFVYSTLPPTTTPSSGANVITPKLLEDIKEASCPNECEGHGVCNNGTCVCNDPFTSFDCSIDKTKPPVMLGIPDKGECDLQERRCAQTAVFGKNFAESEKLSCRLKHFEIDIKNKMKYGESVDVAGQFESMFEVYCPFPGSRDKRSLPDEKTPDNKVSHGYLTSVSNDGKAFSEGDTVVIFDSQCVNCTKVEDKIICTKENEFCVHDGKCYKLDEKIGCHMCDGKSGQDAKWITGPDCTIAPDEEDSANVWIIVVVIVVVVVIAAIVIVAVVFILKKRKNAEVKMVELEENDQ